MDQIRNYNHIVHEIYRIRLNAQQNRCKLVGSYDSKKNIVQPYRYVIGLGEKHFKSFDKDIIKLTKEYPWTQKKHIRFIINELILNSQFSMLRQVVNRVPLKQKVPGYFYLTIHINDKFISAGIEEFGDFFNYYEYIDHYKYFIADNLTFEDYYDEISENKITDINDLSVDKLKLILTIENDLIVPEDSNKIGLNVIENATDNDFYITSFFKDGHYMWKRIHFRVENE